MRSDRRQSRSHRAMVPLNGRRPVAPATSRSLRRLFTPGKASTVFSNRAVLQESAVRSQKAIAMRSWRAKIGYAGASAARWRRSAHSRLQRSRAMSVLRRAARRGHMFRPARPHDDLDLDALRAGAAERTGSAAVRSAGRCNQLSGPRPETYHFMPTTIESGPTRCSTRVSRNPTIFIQLRQSALV